MSSIANSPCLPPASVNCRSWMVQSETKQGKAMQQYYNAIFKKNIIYNQYDIVDI